MDQEVSYIGMLRASQMAKVSTQWLAKIAEQGKVPGSVVIAGRRVFDLSQFTPWVKEYVKRPKQAAHRGVNRSLSE